MIWCSREQFPLNFKHMLKLPNTLQRVTYNVYYVLLIFFFIFTNENRYYRSLFLLLDFVTLYKVVLLVAFVLLVYLTCDTEFYYERIIKNIYIYLDFLYKILINSFLLYAYIYALFHYNLADSVWFWRYVWAVIKRYV